MAKTILKAKKSEYNSGFCTLYFDIQNEGYEKTGLCAIDVMNYEDDIDQIQFYTCNKNDDWKEPCSPIDKKRFEIEVVPC